MFFSWLLRFIVRNIIEKNKNYLFVLSFHILVISDLENRFTIYH